LHTNTFIIPVRAARGPGAASRSGGAMSSSPLFQGLSKAERAALDQRARLREFAEGENLFAQGDTANELFVITKGRVKVWRASEDGGVLTLTLLGRGQPIGTLGAADNRLNHANATAITRVEAQVWRIEDLRQLMESSPPLAANVMRTITNYAEQLIERLEEMASVPVEQRIARTLLRMARRAYGEETTDGCELPLSRQDLADLTSATLPTVSRIMSRWRGERLIAGARGRVRLLDLAALARIAERPAD
jgi:CRP/FNR family transcriptional regulator, nitrogen oxide reductase regulator